MSFNLLNRYSTKAKSNSKCISPIYLTWGCVVYTTCHHQQYDNKLTYDSSVQQTSAESTVNRSR
jgi:hypothetical protein